MKRCDDERRKWKTEGIVVDLGCGSGIWTTALADSGYEVVGVDISPAMIEIACQRVPEARFHVLLRKASAINRFVRNDPSRSLSSRG